MSRCFGPLNDKRPSPDRRKPLSLEPGVAYFSKKLVILICTPPGSPFQMVVSAGDASR